MMDVGRRIKEGRKRLGMTRTQLARRIGVSYTQISNYESGYSYPSFRVAVRLVDLFGDNLFLPNRRGGKVKERTRGPSR